MWQSIINAINPYFYIVTLRNLLYDFGVFKSKKVSVPVISVGNLSCGGTGKTSLVRFLAEKLSQDNSLLILSRGYRRRSKGFKWVLKEGRVLADFNESGDEPYLLARFFEENPRVSVAVCEKRFEGAMKALKELRPNLIILDDGFQHRALYRDLDLVLLKRKDLYDKLLPFGRLREPKGSLKRANALILAYQEICPFEFSLENKPVFKMYRKNFRLLNYELKPLETFKDIRFIAFSALGDNEQFFKTLERIGIKLKKRLSFPDHWDYKGFIPKEDEFYLTTPKDFVKLRPSPNIFILDFEVDVPGLEEFVKDVILKKACSGCG